MRDSKSKWMEMIDVHNMYRWIKAHEDDAKDIIVRLDNEAKGSGPIVDDAFLVPLMYRIAGVPPPPASAFAKTPWSASRSSGCTLCKMASSSSRSDGANPNSFRHLSLAQISFRARSRIQMPKLAASTAKLIRSSFSRNPASLACNSPTSCDARRTSRPNS